MTYAEKLKDPRWQKLRLEVLNRDNFTCISCYNKEKTLHVHHLTYEWGKDPWDYPEFNFLTLCEDCHSEIEEGRKERDSTMMYHLKMGLKDKFIQDCALSVLGSYYLNDLFFLLWELGPQRAMQSLQDTFQNATAQVEINWKKKCFESNICPACAGKMEKVKAYSANRCKSCGFAITVVGIEENKSPVETGLD